MGESTAGIGEAPDYLAVVHALEDGVVVIEIAVQIAVFNCFYSLQGLVVALRVKHSTGEQGSRRIAVHPSCGRCRLREMLNGKAGIPFDGIPALFESIAFSVLGGDGHFIKSVVEDDSESILDRGVTAHHHKFHVGSEKENLGLDSGVLVPAEVGLVHIKVFESLVETAYPAVAGSPAVEVIAGDALLAGNGHNQVAVTGAADNAAVFEYVGKAVGHIGIGATERTTSELAPLGYYLIEIVHIQIGVGLAAHRIGHIVLGRRVEVNRTAGSEGEHRRCKQCIISVLHLFLLFRMLNLRLRLPPSAEDSSRCSHSVPQGLYPKRKGRKW